MESYDQVVVIPDQQHVGSVMQVSFWDILGFFGELYDFTRRFTRMAILVLTSRVFGMMLTLKCHVRKVKS